MSKHQISTLLVLSCLGSQVSMAEEVDTDRLTEVKTAYYQRDYQTLAHLLQTPGLSPLQQDIWQVALAVARQADNQKDLLHALTERYPDNAEAHYQAGRLWYEVKENSSFINKLGYIDLHVQHMLRANELAPNTPKYMFEAAKALAWENLWGWDKEVAQQLVVQLAALDQQYHLVAAMDFAQNTQDSRTGEQLITQVKTEFADNLRLMERAAQLQLTYDQKAPAQQSFYQSCMLTPHDVTLLPKWRDACQWSAHLSLQGYGEKTQGMAAISRLLEEDKVYDEDYVQSLLLQGELAEAMAQPLLARQSYEDALAITKDKASQKQIRRALKALSR